MGIATSTIPPCRADFKWDGAPAEDLYALKGDLLARQGEEIAAANERAAGIEILRQGGNAVDAAVATGFALAVTYPRAGNIGGGGFMVIHSAARNEDVAIDYRETAPAAATRNMYLDAAGNVQTDKSQNGHLSSGVPGTVAGLFQTLPYAKLGMEALIQPAIELAERGFVITAAEARSLNGLQGDLKRI